MFQPKANSCISDGKKIYSVLMKVIDKEDDNVENIVMSRELINLLVENPKSENGRSDYSDSPIIKMAKLHDITHKALNKETASANPKDEKIKNLKRSRKPVITFEQAKLTVFNSSKTSEQVKETVETLTESSKTHQQVKETVDTLTESSKSKHENVNTLLKSNLSHDHTKDVLEIVNAKSNNFEPKEMLNSHPKHNGGFSQHGSSYVSKRKELKMDRTAPKTRKKICAENSDHNGIHSWTNLPKKTAEISLSVQSSNLGTKTAKISLPTNLSTENSDIVQFSNPATKTVDRQAAKTCCDAQDFDVVCALLSLGSDASQPSESLGSDASQPSDEICSSNQNKLTKGAAAVLLSEPSAKGPAAVLLSEPSAKGPAAVLLSEPSAKGAAAVLLSELPAKGRAAVLLSEPSAKGPAVLEKQVNMKSKSFNTKMGDQPVICDTATSINQSGSRVALTDSAQIDSKVSSTNPNRMALTNPSSTHSRLSSTNNLQNDISEADCKSTSTKSPEQHCSKPAKRRMVKGQEKPGNGEESMNIGKVSHKMRLPCVDDTVLSEPCLQLNNKITAPLTIARLDRSIEPCAVITRLVESERILDSSQSPIAGHVLLVEEYGSIAPSTVNTAEGSIPPSTVHMADGCIAPSTVHLAESSIVPSIVHMADSSIAPSTVHMADSSIASSTVHMTHVSNRVPMMEYVKIAPETNEMIHREQRIVSKPIYLSSSDDETTTTERETNLEQHHGKRETNEEQHYDKRETNLEQHYGKRETNLEQYYGKRETNAEKHYDKRETNLEQHYGKREIKRMKTFITDNVTSVQSVGTVTCTQPTYQSCQPVYTVCPVSVSLVQSGCTVPCTQVTYRSSPLLHSVGSDDQRGSLRCPDQCKTIPICTDGSVLHPGKRVLMLAKQRPPVGVGVSDNNIRVLPTPAGNQDRGLPTSSGNQDRGLPIPLVHISTSTRNEPELEQTFLARNVLKHVRNTTQLRPNSKPYSVGLKNGPKECKYTKLRTPAIASPVGVNTTRPAPNVIFLADRSHANKTIYKTSLGLHNAYGLLRPNLACLLDNKDLSISCRKSSSVCLGATKSCTDPFPSQRVKCVKNMECYPVVDAHREALESFPSPPVPCDGTERQHSALDLSKQKVDLSKHKVDLSKHNVVNGTARHKPLDFSDDLQKISNTLTEYPSTDPVIILTSYNPLTSTSTSAESDFHRLTTPQPCKDSNAVTNRLTTFQPCIDSDVAHTETQVVTVERQQIESHKSKGLMSNEKEEKRLDTSLTKSLEDILSQRIESCENTDIKTWLKHCNLTDLITILTSKDDYLHDLKVTSKDEDYLHDLKVTSKDEDYLHDLKMLQKSKPKQFFDLVNSMGIPLQTFMKFSSLLRQLNKEIRKQEEKVLDIPYRMKRMRKSLQEETAYMPTG